MKGSGARTLIVSPSQEVFRASHPQLPKDIHLHHPNEMFYLFLRDDDLRIVILTGYRIFVRDKRSEELISR
jgi:hypothetical protein